jgi:DNA-directed RNA polymerase specialized sigma24 family protein
MIVCPAITEAPPPGRNGGGSPSAPLSHAQRTALVERWSGLPIWIARKLCPPERRDVIDELVAEGTLAMWRASARFDPRRGCFSTFAFAPIYWRLKRFLFLERRRVRTVSLDCPTRLFGYRAYCDGEEGGTVGERMADLDAVDPADEAARAEAADLFRRAIQEHCPLRYAEVVLRRLYFPSKRWTTAPSCGRRGGRGRPRGVEPW